MAIKIPGVDYPELTPDQQKSEKKAKEFRGEFLEQIIEIENDIETCITKYIKPGRPNLEGILHYYLYGHINFLLKVDTLRQIIRADIESASKYMGYFELIIKLVELRNYVAHNRVELNNTNNIIFYRLITIYKSQREITGNDNKVYWGDAKKVEITDKVCREIFKQLQIAHGFLVAFRILFEGDATNDKLLKENLAFLHKELEPKLAIAKEKLGVFSIGLDNKD